MSSLHRLIKCTIYASLPKQPINKFDLVQQSRQQGLRAYFPNIYTVFQIGSIDHSTATTRRRKKTFPPSNLQLPFSVT